MSFRNVVRQSKFRHVFGNNLKRDQCLENIKVSKATWDGEFCSVNPKFVALVVDAVGGGAFLVLPLSKATGRLDAKTPLVAGHKGPVLDVAWCPHNDNVIASGSEDTSVKIWQIPNEGVTSTMTECIVSLDIHQRRVGDVLWHPSAQNILMSSSSDNTAVIWNVGTGEALNIISLPDNPLSSCWNWNGSEVLFSCKDKKLHRIDPRDGKVLESGASHEGSKPCKAIYLKNGDVFTTGFTKHSERQYSLRKSGSIGEPVEIKELDTSTGVMFPVYDPDTSIVYLCGKGDSVIRYFEVTPEAPFVHYIDTYQGSGPQRGIGSMPKRGCNFMSCEINRFYRVNNVGFCQVIEFKVPRKSELFQDDLFPDTISDVPALTAEQWFVEKKDSDPILLPVEQIGGQTSQEATLEVNQKPTANILNSARPVGAAAVSNQRSAMSELEMKKLESTILEQCKKQTESMTKKYQRQVEDLTEEVRNLKSTISKQDNRIFVLETQMSDSGNKTED